MASLWQVTRNPYGRAVYDWLTDHGVTATVMYEYRRRLDGEAADGHHTPADDTEPTVGVGDPAALDFGGTDPPLAERREDEELIVATTDGTVRGYLFLTVDATLRVHPLERELSFEGAYVRRVFVHPDYREQGIASATLRAALDRARERGARTATALVAADNRPSQWLFESHEFERVRRRVYGRVGSLSWRRVDEL
jgi:ribosomal protein S18 acetylase RimI-like enzyme